jgi:hypothetical protein
MPDRPDDRPSLQLAWLRRILGHDSAATGPRAGPGVVVGATAAARTTPSPDAPALPPVTGDAARQHDPGGASMARLACAILALAALLTSSAAVS